MGEALTVANKKLLTHLLKRGRWANKSEIVRYGLHLVSKEVEAHDYRPFTPDELRRAAQAETAEDRAEYKKMVRNSKPQYPND